MDPGAILGIIAGALCGGPLFCWATRRCSVHGSLASMGWPEADPTEITDLVRICNIILGSYEKDLEHPAHARDVLPSQVLKQVGYSKEKLRCPPYLIYVDHSAKNVCLAIRGLQLLHEQDYITFLKTWRAHQPLDCGFVHRGFFLSAQLLVTREIGTLTEALRHHAGYSLTVAGHSLGAGVAVVVTLMLLSQSCPWEGFRQQPKVSCVSVAPPRVASRSLCDKFAVDMTSVILQDDFLPRTSIPIHIIFAATCCLPCVLGLSCLKDSFLPRDAFSPGEAHLCVPGRVYHIVYTRSCSCRVHPPVVRTAVPDRWHFDEIVCSLSAITDHSLVRSRAKLEEVLQMKHSAASSAHQDAPRVQEMV